MYCIMFLMITGALNIYCRFFTYSQLMKSQGKLLVSLRNEIKIIFGIMYISMHIKLDLVLSEVTALYSPDSHIWSSYVNHTHLTLTN